MRGRSMKLRAPNYAEVASTKALMLARGRGRCLRRRRVAGKDIVMNAVTTKHVKKGTVRQKDLNPVVGTKLDTKASPPV